MRKLYVKPDAEILKLSNLQAFLNDSYEQEEPEQPPKPNNGMGNSDTEIGASRPSIW